MWESPALQRQQRISAVHHCGDRCRVGTVCDIQLGSRQLSGQLDAGIVFIRVFQKPDDLRLAVGLTSERNGGGRPALRMVSPEVFAPRAGTVVISICLRSSAGMPSGDRIVMTIVAAVAMRGVPLARGCRLHRGR